MHQRDAGSGSSPQGKALEEVGRELIISVHLFLGHEREVTSLKTETPNSDKGSSL